MSRRRWARRPTRDGSRTCLSAASASRHSPMASRSTNEPATQGLGRQRGSVPWPLPARAGTARRGAPAMSEEWRAVVRDRSADDDAVRRPGHRHWTGVRAVPEAAPPRGVPVVPAPDRPGGAGGVGHPPGTGQLRDAQARQGQAVAGGATPLPSALHAHLGVLVESGGAVVRLAQPAGDQAGFVPQRRRSGEQDPSVHRRLQYLRHAVRLGRHWSWSNSVDRSTLVRVRCRSEVVPWGGGLRLALAVPERFQIPPRGSWEVAPARRLPPQCGDPWRSGRNPPTWDNRLVANGIL